MRTSSAAGIALRPHVWLSEEWFSPDGVPGIAVPFYLAHPRLERLERRIMREAEGGNTRLLLRILRHEAGQRSRRQRLGSLRDSGARACARRFGTRLRSLYTPGAHPYPVGHEPVVQPPAPNRASTDASTCMSRHHVALSWSTSIS